MKNKELNDYQIKVIDDITKKPVGSVNIQMKKEKTIEIRCGNFDESQQLFEAHMFPDRQIESVNLYIDRVLSRTERPLIVIHTNSVYIVESLNKFSKEYKWNIDFYLNDIKVDAEVLFAGFSKPFERLIFN